MPCAVYLLSRTFSRSLAVMVLSTCKDIRWCAKTGTYCSADSSIKRFTSCFSKPSSCKTQGKLPDFTLEKRRGDTAACHHARLAARTGNVHVPALGNKALLKAFCFPRDSKAQKPNSWRSSGPRCFMSTTQNTVLGRINQPFRQLTSAAAAALPTPGDLHNGQSSDQPLWGHPCSCFHSTRSMAQYQKPKGAVALRQICT